MFFISRKKYNEAIANEVEAAYEELLQKAERKIGNLEFEVKRLKGRLTNKEIAHDKEISSLKRQMEAKNAVPGIRCFCDDTFYKIWHSYDARFCCPPVEQEKVYELEFKVEDEATRLVICIPKGASFANLEQATEILVPRAYPVAKVLNLVKFEAKFLPGSFVQYHDEEPNAESVKTLGEGNKWKYEITLSSPKMLTFLVFVPKRDPLRNDETPELERLIEERKAELTELCASFGESCTRILDGGTDWLFCLEARPAYLDRLRQSIADGVVPARNVDTKESVTKLQNDCMKKWQERFLGIVLS